jgi:hypothetical protein
MKDKGLNYLFQNFQTLIYFLRMLLHQKLNQLLFYLLIDQYKNQQEHPDECYLTQLLDMTWNTQCFQG